MTVAVTKISCLRPNLSLRREQDDTSHLVRRPKHLALELRDPLRPEVDYRDHLFPEEAFRVVGAVSRAGPLEATCHGCSLRPRLPRRLTKISSPGTKPGERRKQGTQYCAKANRGRPKRDAPDGATPRRGQSWDYFGKPLEFDAAVHGRRNVVER